MIHVTKRLNYLKGFDYTVHGHVLCNDLSPVPSPQERGVLLFTALSFNSTFSLSPVERGLGREVDCTKHDRERYDHSDSAWKKHI